MKGFTVADLAPLAIAFVILTIVVGVGALILSEMNETVTVAKASYVLDKGLDAMTTFGDWFGILVIIVVAAVIIGLVITYFRGRLGA